MQNFTVLANKMIDWLMLSIKKWTKHVSYACMLIFFIFQFVKIINQQQQQSNQSINQQKCIFLLIGNALDFFFFFWSNQSMFTGGVRG